ncbi:MAG: hypothetical protein DI626_01175 [Micavibrio aeruginosavorus]|uniref:Uncharacterized protein n=1 Tax=Micavibrio aeruginosavorus TaxID=349221 RepID=A0A2W5A2A4_9BACT|nr:MAG: hypothetical protein DI626_01175 [Micavibrio aeruginosavorus]
MPAQNREPEQKILLKSSKDLMLVREIISDARNAFLIPDQNYEHKDPLTSILIDSANQALLDEDDYTLRYRFELNPETGEFTQGDYNEKSGMKTSNVIGGCTDRIEREREQEPDESKEQAYNAFIKQQRMMGDPARCDNLKFSDLAVGAAYQAARNEVGVAFKHPTDNVMIVFEMCEDIWHSMDSNFNVMQRYVEAEIEPKQVWGEIPARIRDNPENFQEYIYNAMTMFRDHLHKNIPGSSINMKSKAELTKEDIANSHALDKGLLKSLGLSRVFEYAVSILGGQTNLEDALTACHKSIYYHGLDLHREKQNYNIDTLKPRWDRIGHGNGLMISSNDNYMQRQPGMVPVAAYH